MCVISTLCMSQSLNKAFLQRLEVRATGSEPGGHHVRYFVIRCAIVYKGIIKELGTQFKVGMIEND